MMRDAEQHSGITRGAAMHTMAEQETNIHVIERDVDMLEMNRLDV